MEMKIDVEVGEYLSREELKDEIKCAVEEYVAREVNDYFKVRSYKDFIGKVASDAFWRCIENMGEDTRGAVRNAVRKKIVELQPHQLMDMKFNFKTNEYEPSHVQRIIDEEADRMRPEISAVLRSAVEKAVGDDLPSVFADAVFDLLSNKKEASE